MKNTKKLLVASSLILAMGVTSISAFAAPNRPGVPARDGSGRKAGAGVYDKLGKGQGGTGKGLGIGGMRLQDGSCYIK